MNQLQEVKNLYIILTPPAPDAPPNTIATFALFGHETRQSQIHGLLLDPLSPNEHKSLYWYLEDYWKWPYFEFATRGRQVEALLVEVGQRLYRAVFGSVPAQDLVKQWLNQPDRSHQITIVSDLPRVLGLPWELMHDEHSFVALNSSHPVSIVRSLPQDEQRVVSKPFEPPLRILLVTARPQGVGFIDPRSIASELLDEIQDQIETGGIALELLRPPTLQALRSRLVQTEQPVHVLHFDGHGMFDEKQEKQGTLLFETETGLPSVVNASNLARMLRTSGIQLVVLTACQSAVGATDDAFSSVAMQLLRNNMDAVIAMSASVLVVSASRYVETFYRSLATGTSVPVAQEMARQALHNDPRRHILRHHSSEEGHPVELQDWWLPHFYLQRPIILQPIQDNRPGKPSQQIPFARRLNEEMPLKPRYGFSGRASELHQIERLLLLGKLVIIHGFSGVGKTALVREAADWFTRTGMYEKACFVSFEHGGDAATLLSALSHFLDIYDSDYTPKNKEAVLKRLEQVLQQRRTLVVADNLESILPQGEVPLTATTRSELFEMLLKLASMGAGMLLTSRDTAFGDKRLAPGDHVAYVVLGGLKAEDAYMLACNLLNDLKIDPKRASYAQLCNLLVHLDHHPLAIQLVLPVLRELPLSKIEADFVTLLPTFASDAQEGYKQSLLASLDYSLRRLSKKQRTLLSCLAPFEGGVSEQALLTITQIPQHQWSKLCQIMEEAALLTVEPIHKDISNPFLHFHPLLTPFLRSEHDTADASLRERYVRYYFGLVTYLTREYYHIPVLVHALVKRELPNLRRALKLLLEASKLDDNTGLINTSVTSSNPTPDLQSKLDDAIAMTEMITTFLTHLGLLWEREELWQWVAEVMAAKGTQKGGKLTYTEWLRESSFGQEEEFKKGNFHAAFARFTDLLARIEAQPEGTRLGRGSHEHFKVLTMLARILRAEGYPTVAEERMREAFVIFDALIKQESNPTVRDSFIHDGAQLLSDLGDVLLDQGKYTEARAAFEEVLSIAVQQDDVVLQATAVGSLGGVAYKQNDYASAKLNYTKAKKLDRDLKVPRMEAVDWHQLGLVAQAQEEWTEAEVCYRESLALWEELDNEEGVAASCNELGAIALATGRVVEAVGWYTRALESRERIQPGSLPHAGTLLNLATVLLHAVQEGHVDKKRLIVARSYAEQALTIMEEQKRGAETVVLLDILATIARLEGHVEVEWDYRRRGREAYAVYESSHLDKFDRDRQFFIETAVAAAKGDQQAQKWLEAALAQLETAGWNITSTIQRILAGERDESMLVADLSTPDAFLISKILETLALTHE